MPAPIFPAEWQALVDQAATALRALALDEAAKEKFCNDPLLRPYMHKVSQRYVAGSTVAEALARAERSIAQGHAASVWNTWARAYATKPSPWPRRMSSWT